MKKAFIDTLEERLSTIDEALANFETTPLPLLNARASEKTWNVLENIEHLHRYNEFYLKEFRKSLDRADVSKSDEMKRGKFGMKSAQSMLPVNGELANPMRTFRSKNPLFTAVDTSILTIFTREQVELKAIVEEARGKDIGAVRCKTTLPLIRFHLCDALEFVINHQVRHIEQAKRALNNAAAKI